MEHLLPSCLITRQIGRSIDQVKLLIWRIGSLFGLCLALNFWRCQCGTDFDISVLSGINVVNDKLGDRENYFADLECHVHSR